MVSLTLPFATLLMLIKDDSVGFTIFLRAMAVVFLLGGIYYLLILFYNAARIEAGPTHVRLRVPRTRGMFVLPSIIRRAEIAYDAIKAIEELARKFISGFGLGTAERAYSLVTRNGTRIPLGIEASYRYPPLAYAEAAEEIATRAGTAVIDRGAVRIWRHAFAHCGTARQPGPRNRCCRKRWQNTKIGTASP